MITIPLVEGIPVIEQEPEGMTLKESKKFIFKVYICLLFQLFSFLTCVSISKFYDLRTFYISDLGRAFLGLSLFFTFIPLFVSCCCERYFVIFPINYILLCLFTLSTSYTLSSISTFINGDTLLLALGITTIDTLAMTFVGLLSFWEMYVSYFNQFLIMLTISFISIGIINVFIMSNYLHLFIACTGSVLFSGFIIYDTKMITDRTYKVYKKEDFIIASINLYLDIINLFTYVLQILSFSDDSN